MQKLFFACSLCLPVAFVHCTYSIVALDTKNGQIGAAGATCIKSNDLDIRDILYRSVAGKGVIVTQALLLEDDSPPVVQGKKLLSDGANPADIINAMIAADTESIEVAGESFELSKLRQYAVIDFQGRFSGYTGPSISALYKALEYGESIQKDMQASWEGYVYSVQGNVVANGTIVAAERGFQKAASDDAGVSLSDRLLDALFQVPEDGVGDIRCGDEAASIAFLRVETKEGTIINEINIGYEEGGQGPFESLKEELVSCNGTIPCIFNTNAKASGASTNFISSIALALLLLTTFTLA